MNRIVFSGHAREKFQILTRHSLYISEDEVKEEIIEPDKRLMKGMS